MSGVDVIRGETMRCYEFECLLEKDLFRLIDFPFGGPSLL